MPLIHVTLLSGRGEEEIAALGRAVTEAVHTTLGTPREAIRVTVDACPPEHWFVGGVSMAEKKAARGG
ncbi:MULTISPECIES: tautomerase family protein [Streptomyces]|uniref:Tautomerase family protein n=1 Tax=Streptomyces flaveolus TaxID=67297 RepID=A0ABV3AIR2_9ACTN|nr:MULTISPECIES: tautomerase family protein [Streptomyces]KMS87268.1 4-oxalocrotonate tautomerase [Streptomyces regensis]KOG74819.1 4-oxalocrotonate tautomerase [Streptomyces antibioticus]KOV76491.1 4-oxalocrotonate tautomerase [Streptomyces sp. NRRL WC-3723]MBG7697713.1 tautomerase family protein [Streptomyces sp. MC1]